MVNILSSSSRKTLAFTLGGGVLFLTGVALSYGYDIQVDVEARSAEPDEAGVYVPSYTRQSGPQILMVYVGSSTCPWSNQPEVQPAVEAIKRSLADNAAGRGLSFKALGIALDWSPQRGFEHLSKVGFFDEVSTGYSWGNSVAIDYAGTNGSAPLATPFILVYRQTLVTPRDSVNPGGYEERDRKTLIVKGGVEEITEWADAGAPLPNRDTTGS